MSDTPAAESAAEPLFSIAEVEQFTDDDTVAGRAIGKMLSVLFLYTVFAMALVTWWTYTSVAEDNAAAAQLQETHADPAH